MKILFLENHAIFAEQVICEFLQGHSVAVVPNIVLARDVVAQQQFDVVLCDYDLNDGKGTEFVQECRAHRSTIPVIAVSAHDQGNAALV